MNNLAPIGICTYSRIDHLKQTIEALKKNTLAKASELYIFSDAPQAGDEKVVAEMRGYLHTIDGFKLVRIIERKTNGKVANCRGGMMRLIHKHGKIIFLEDDIITAPRFLQFMNDMLVKYEDNQEIFSISGYCPPIEINEDYPHEVFLLPRFNGWGFASWKDRFDRLDQNLDRSEVMKRFFNPAELYRFTRGGWDMLPMLAADASGKIDALDVKIFYQQFKWKMFTIFPRRSLVNNIGFDGTGIHCKKTERFDVDLRGNTEKTSSYPASISADPDIVKAHFEFRSGNLFLKIRHFLAFLYRII